MGNDAPLSPRGWCLLAEATAQSTTERFQNVVDKLLQQRIIFAFVKLLECVCELKFQAWAEVSESGW